MKKVLNTLLALTLCVALMACTNAEDTQKVIVFAAASTTNAVTDLGDLFAEKNMGRIIPSFASSSTLAKQIEHGAPAEIYLSANTTWMNYLENKNKIDPKTRFDLLGNRIVLIAPSDSSIKVTIAPGFDLVGLLKDNKLSMGDPDHVPAGIYGKQALQSLGIWEAIVPKVARAKDARAALTLVERREAPLGIVYATDAAISEKVKIVGIFPEDSHPSITYPVAMVAGKSTPVAAAFLEFLKSPEAGIIYKKYGFSVQ